MIGAVLSVALRVLIGGHITGSLNNTHENTHLYLVWPWEHERMESEHFYSRSSLFFVNLLAQTIFERMWFVYGWLWFWANEVGTLAEGVMLGTLVCRGSWDGGVLYVELGHASYKFWPFWLLGRCALGIYLASSCIVLLLCFCVDVLLYIVLYYCNSQLWFWPAGAFFNRCHFLLQSKCEIEHFKDELWPLHHNRHVIGHV